MPEWVDVGSYTVGCEVDGGREVRGFDVIYDAQEQKPGLRWTSSNSEDGVLHPLTRRKDTLVTLYNARVTDVEKMLVDIYGVAFKQRVNRSDIRSEHGDLVSRIIGEARAERKAFSQR